MSLVDKLVMISEHILLFVERKNDGEYVVDEKREWEARMS